MENKKQLEILNGSHDETGGDALSAGLYLCATPIGNLGDITLRTIKTLKAVDKIYCEDTRNTLRLLNALGIKKPLESCHEHNEKSRSARIADEVALGGAVAFVSDAGMPGVSDPGAALIKKFIELGLPFEVQPGASALTTAWVMSGFSTESLLFLGFLPRKGAKRAALMERIVKSEDTVLIYESPLRVGATLAEIAAAMRAHGENPQARGCALVREITKTFEECVRGNVSELAERYEKEPPRGECVLVIGAKEGAERGYKGTESLDGGEAGEDGETGGKGGLILADARLDALLCALLNEGISVKTAAKIASDALGIPRNTAYRRAMELRNAE